MYGRGVELGMLRLRSGKDAGRVAGRVRMGVITGEGGRGGGGGDGGRGDDGGSDGASRE